jgi:hypothetical protein
LVLPKSRAGGHYAITGQFLSWNEKTKEMRLYIEKDVTSIKIIKDNLTRARVTQIQVCSFPHNNPKPAQWALGSVKEHGLRDGSSLAMFGKLKFQCCPPPSL